MEVNKENDKYNVLSLSTDAFAQTNSNIGIELNGSVAFSIGAWVQFNGLGYKTSIISKDGVFNLGIEGNSIVCQISGYPTVYSNAIEQPIGESQWHNICITFDGAQLRIYIDGEFNIFVSVFGNGTTNANPYLIGKHLQGEIREVRIYNTTLDADAVLAYLYNEPDMNLVAAYFDFTQNPPVDRSSQQLPISLEEGAIILTKYPALCLAGTAYAQPLQDESVNPGGYQNDAYTIQSWVYVSSKLPLKQIVFINNDLEEDSGMALFLEYDAAGNGFRVKSQRGSGTSDENILSSNNLVELNKWTNIATTFDGVNLAIYIDGVLDKVQQFPPISLIEYQSNLLIGASLVQGRPTGAYALPGYISRLEVWDTALSDIDISNYMDAIPDIPTIHLTASYNFMTDSAQNVVNGHPVGLAAGAVLDFQSAKTPKNSASDKIFSKAIEDITPELLQSFRDSVNFSDILGKAGSNPFAKNKENELEFATQFIEESDLASFKEKIANAWDDMENKLRKNPKSIQFTVTRHEVDGYHLIVCHNARESYVAGKIKMGSISEYDLWVIQLIFTVIAGILDALFGVRSKLDKAISYILKISKDPLIMSFLAVGATMSAATIFAIGRSLCTQGYLKPLIKLVVDMGFWTIIRIIVKAILTFLGIGAADIIASLVATALTFIKIYLEKPDTCDDIPAVNITEITFYDSSFGAANALAIRRNATQAITTPEWTAQNNTAEMSPAAYCIAEKSEYATGEVGYVHLVKIKAKFLISTLKPITASVRAFSKNGILGDIPAFNVSFLFGSSCLLTIELPNDTIGENGVDVSDEQLQWQYSLETGIWINMEATNHRIYAVLSTPNAPWGQINYPDNTQLPWTDVLDYACKWAKGAKTLDEAATKITKEVYAGIKLKYISNKQYIYDQKFKCTEFCNNLKNANINNIVNCEDCAAIVSTFANILGCKLGIGRIGRSFKYNKIVLIGANEWKDGVFSYHNVAFKDEPKALRDSYLFDACLMLDGSDDPWSNDNDSTKIPLLPANIKFTTNVENIINIPVPYISIDSYRERLATNNADGIGKCDTSNNPLSNLPVI